MVPSVQEISSFLLLILYFNKSKYFRLKVDVRLFYAKYHVVFINRLFPIYLRLILQDGQKWSSDSNTHNGLHARNQWWVK